tara:strand:- start:1220 stop:1981 length:762 start_codon:yes stop_codon:yes gene_type:complete
MAINMFAGERYTFAASNGLPLLNHSTDGAGGTSKFHNKVFIGSGGVYNGSGASILRIECDDADIQDGPQLHLRQIGTGNTGITFDQADGTNTCKWTIGIDSSESTDFQLSPANNIYHSGTGYVMSLSQAGDLKVTGDVIAYDSSDRRMKDNIVNIDDPLGKLKQLNGVYFDWNNEGPDWTKSKDEDINTNPLHDIGVIAQEVQSVIPEAVSVRSNGYLAVDYKRLIPLLIEGINDQQRQIETLTDRIKKLENR